MVFSAAVTGFTNSDVTITGTAGGTKTVTVTGSGTTYNVAVSGMTTSGTVIATIPANAADERQRTGQPGVDQHGQHRDLERRHRLDHADHVGTDPAGRA